MVVKLSVEYGCGSETHHCQVVFVDVYLATGRITHVYAAWQLWRYIKWWIDGSYEITYPGGYGGRGMLQLDLAMGIVRKTMLREVKNQ